MQSYSPSDLHPRLVAPQVRRRQLNVYWRMSQSALSVFMEQSEFLHSVFVNLWIFEAVLDQVLIRAPASSASVTSPGPHPVR